MTLADVRLDERGAAVVAVLSGEIDLSNAQGLGQAITRGVSHEAWGVVLDLGQLQFLDSAGIQLVYQLRESLRARRQELTVVIPTDSPAADALRLAGVGQDFNTAQSTDEALPAA